MGWTGRDTGTLLMWWSIYLSTCEGAMQTHIHLRTLVVSGTLVVDAFHRQGDMRMYLARNRQRVHLRYLDSWPLEQS